MAYTWFHVVLVYMQKLTSNVKGRRMSQPNPGLDRGIVLETLPCFIYG